MIKIIHPLLPYLDQAQVEAFKKAGIYYFSERDNYTNNFGFQWNLFTKTQIDDSEIKQSFDRFFKVTEWKQDALFGKNILEVGSGAGRFSRVVLENTQANLYSVDYSDAVKANHENNKQFKERLQLFQASIYELPFAKNQFDKVFCFGVLQHTPDVKRSVKCLSEMLKENGELIVDFYPVKGWWTKIHAKYIFRPYTTKMSNEKLLKLIEKNIDWLINAYYFFDNIGLGKIVNRFLPVCDIKNTLPPNLSKEKLREFAILDTFDMFSPTYDQPQKLKTVKKWFIEFGLKDVTAKYIYIDNRNSVAVVRGIR